MNPAVKQAEHAADRSVQAAASARRTLRCTLIVGLCALVLAVLGGLGALYVSHLQSHLDTATGNLTDLQTRIDKETANLAGLSAQLRQTRQVQYEGCVRSNTLRANDRYVLGVLRQISLTVSAASTNDELAKYFSRVAPQLARRAAAPEEQPRDCSTLADP